jgi:FkbM family methyltransferase
VETREIRKAGATFEVTVADGAQRDFWNWYESDAWEPDTVAVFARFLTPATRYLDLGAWIGPTALLAAATVAHVVCVEPDPLAYAALARNLALNPDAAAKTLALELAVGADDGVATLTSPGPGGDSFSSLVRPGDTGARWTVERVGIETLLARPDVDGVDFVKLDVEGAEYEIVPALHASLRARRPTLYVATHPNMLLDRSSRLATLRSGLGALRANRRMLKALLAYRHHYVYDPATRRFRDVRRLNVLRVLLPLPLRACFAIGATVFTDERLDGGQLRLPVAEPAP